MTRPFGPNEVTEGKKIPDAVLEAFNEAIADAFSSASRRAVVTQDEVVDRILAKMPDVQREQIFKHHWLDVEDVYRAKGWRVTFDKAGYSESYDATFTFAKSVKGDRR